MSDEKNENNEKSENNSEERKEIVKDLKCDELCFVKEKKELKEKAEDELHDKECPPCERQ